MAAEAQRVLRAFPTKSSEKEGPKPMPSFPDMVAYVQEKAAQRIKTPAKYIVGTSTIPFNPSAFAEVPIKQRPATLRDEVSVRTLSFFLFLLPDRSIPEDVSSPQRRGYSHVHAAGGHAGRRARHRTLCPRASVLRAPGLRVQGDQPDPRLHGAAAAAAIRRGR